MIPNGALHPFQQDLLTWPKTMLIALNKIFALSSAKGPCLGYYAIVDSNKNINFQFAFDKLSDFNPFYTGNP